MRLSLKISAIILSGALYAQSSTVAAEEAHYFDLPLERLMDVVVTTVSKKEEKVKRAPAATYVLTANDIRRMGVNSVPEALRGVPGIHVARIDANKWAVSSRGFTTQFTPNLLVLVDGRTVYNPIFSGVWWDTQDLFLEDIDRIEVVRGPGGTLWGSNAVNGVINIITKHAEDTQGTFASVHAGTHERAGASVRYGGQTQKGWDYRVYAKHNQRASFDTIEGLDNQDEWNNSRAGFRLDGNIKPDSELSVQGDIYHGELNNRYVRPSVVPPSYNVVKLAEDEISGGHLMAKWQHKQSERSTTSLQTYFDYSERNEELVGFEIMTYDVDFQHNYNITPRNELVWGAGYRFIDIRTDGNQYTSFRSDDATVNIFSGFVQNEFKLLPETLSLIVGSKFEYNDYTDANVQPNAKAVWTVDDRNVIWGSVARAVRMPNLVQDSVMINNRLGVDPVTVAPGVTLPAFNKIQGRGNTRDEEMIAYELGWRYEISNKISFDTALYFNEYSNLVTGETGLPASMVDPLTGLPFIQTTTTFDYQASAEAYGWETVFNWDVKDNWRLIGSYTLMHLDTEPEPGSNDTLQQLQEDSTPSHMASLRSHLNLSRHIQLDNMLYYVSDLEASAQGSKNIDEYLRFDTRIAWLPSEHVELAVIGQNLLEQDHTEIGNPLFGSITEIPRSVFARVTLRY